MLISLGQIRQYFKTYKRKECDNKSLSPAGVLVPLFERNGELRVLFTQRTNEVEHHKGQVSFPGGIKTKEDKDIVETALRETEEEIGLPRNAVTVLGILSDFPTLTGFCITPVVAFIPADSQFSVSTTEVSQVFDVPLLFFLDSSNERTEQYEHSGKTTVIYFYHYGQYEIWGATAAVLRSFLRDLVSTAG